MLNKTTTLAQTPERCGVYLMLNAKSRILYVGKANNLRQRLRSYFATKLSAKTAKLIQQAVQLRTILTSNETESLLLEDQLIKKHAPPFNVLLRDDKSYPYLWFSDDQFAQLSFRHRKHTKKGTYFGPYTSKSALRFTLDLLEKTFQLRTCSTAVFKQRTKPCLKYQINYCSAPCVGLMSAQNYAQRVKQAKRFLSNNDYTIINQLTTKMHRAATMERFEEATLLRDTITQLRSVQQERNQSIVTHAPDLDIWGVYLFGETALATLLQVRSGALKASLPFSAHNLDDTLTDTLAQMMQQYYISLPGKDIVATIVVATLSQKHSQLAALLEQKSGTRVTITNDQKKPLYQKWLTMAHDNALAAVEQLSNNQHTFSMQFTMLREKLLLPKLTKIECFDVSHMGGKHSICAMTVCTTSGLQKNCYKNFIIRGGAGGDDYAAIQEAVSRRMAYVRAGITQKTTVDKSFLAPPDLLVIDGGKGHLRAVLPALKIHQIASLVLLGIAKGPTRKADNERYYLCHYSSATSIAETAISAVAFNQTPFVLQLVRDQAHNRAITAMRKRMARETVHSNLSALAAIGKKRQQQLLIYFGSLEKLRQVSIEELQKVPGIGKKLAQQISMQLSSH